MYSVVISTIGAKFLFDTLRSLEPFPPDEVIVVLDRVGRSCSSLDSAYPLHHLERDLRHYRIPVTLKLYEPEEQWAVMNGCYNVGWRAAKNPYVLFTHDDVLFPAYDFPATLTKVLTALETHNGVINGREVKGVVLPEWEIPAQAVVPTGTGKDWKLCQCVSPVSQIVSVAAMEALGGFDEADGVWYDGQLQAETFLRNWWFIHLPTPLLEHVSNRTYRLNDWGQRWAPNPIWGNYQQNFENRYGFFFERNLSLEDGLPLTNPEFGL